MFGKRWRLFRLLGFPVSIDASWLIVLFLLTLSFAEEFPAMLHRFFPTDAPLRSTTAYWAMGLFTALAFFGCILLHECGHAVVARARGMHIGGITLFLFGGVAELQDEPESPGTEFLMAIAGPLVSAALARAPRLHGAIRQAILALCHYHSRSWCRSSSPNVAGCSSAWERCCWS